jgi:hypothetical protein
VAVVQLAEGALVAGSHTFNQWPVHGLESGGDSQVVQSIRLGMDSGLEKQVLRYARCARSAQDDTALLAF